MKLPFFAVPLLFTTGIFALSGCVERRVVYRERPPVAVQQPPPVAVQPPPEIIVTQRPPPPRREVVTIAPARDYVWIPGYWTWNGQWAWVAGHWEARPHPRAVWVTGHWSPRRQGYVWVPGYWR